MSCSGRKGSVAIAAGVLGLAAGAGAIALGAHVARKRAAQKQELAGQEMAGCGAAAVAGVPGSAGMAAGTMPGEQEALVCSEHAPVKMTGDGKEYQHGSFPSFLCMGFQKSGTTSLFQIMEQHPDVDLPRDVKEPMYYRILAVRSFGGSWFYRRRYYGFFDPASGHVLGEINAGLTFSHCAKKICQDFPPETKLIFMMREPVSRAYSAYKYFLARGFLPKWVLEDDQRHGHAVAFDHYVHWVLDNKERRSDVMRRRLHYLVLSQSNYATCIEEYLGTFPREQMHFMFFEEFVKDQHASCQKLYDFLGIEDAPGIQYGLHSNEGNERATTHKLANKAKIAKGCDTGWYEFAYMSHWGKPLYHNIHKVYQHYRKLAIVSDFDRSKLLPETRAYLQEYFNDEVRRLENITGRDLHDLWW